MRATPATSRSAAISAILEDRQSSLFAGSVVNVAMKLEADPSTFDATNGVGEVDYEIVTATKSIGTRNGFWRAYVIPAGAAVVPLSKVFFLETGSGRFGIKASYTRGSLPPVFADVKSFQFGFLIESDDKD